MAGDVVVVSMPPKPQVQRVILGTHVEGLSVRQKHFFIETAPEAAEKLTPDTVLVWYACGFSRCVLEPSVEASALRYAFKRIVEAVFKENKSFVKEVVIRMSDLG